MTWNKILLGLLSIGLPGLTLAAEKVEMADQLRANGGIYVVVITLVVILGGLFGYMIFTSRKLKKLEEEVKRQQGA